MAATSGVLSFVMALATGSRSAFAYPLLGVLLTEVVWWYRDVVMLHERSFATALLVGGLCFNVLLYWPSGLIAKGDPSDVGRAEVARCFIAESARSWQEFLCGQGYDRVSDRCVKKVFLPNPPRGIPHAHNAFLQVLADHGVVAFLLMVWALWLGFTRLFASLSSQPLVSPSLD